MKKLATHRRSIRSECRAGLRSAGRIGFNFTILGDGDQTILSGPVTDQAALRGLLNKIWDLNLTLISLERVETNFP